MTLVGHGQASPALIDNLSVSVQLDGGKYDLPLPVKKRMQASVYTIADNVLTGHQAGEVKAKKADYERLIQDVFDRILLGYTVKNVDIIAGHHTEIIVTVIPWQDVIQKVNLTIEVDQLPAKIKNLVVADMQGVEKIFEQVLLGLPIDAVEWTNGILKSSLQEFLHNKLPEFRSDFEIIADDTAQVRLMLYPKGALIRDIDLSLRSESMPNLALINYRPLIQKKTEILLGVPVQFVERHQGYFNEQFTAELSQDNVLRNLGVKTAIEMNVATNTEINIKADTDKYHVFIEGYLDVNKGEDSTSAKIHAGKYISPLDEIFLETDFFPDQMKWVFMPGISRRITPKLTVGYKYALRENHHILWAKQKLGDKYLLRVEHIPEENFNEFAVRYKLHDFFGIEYVVNDHDNWLRLVGYF